MLVQHKDQATAMKVKDLEVMSMCRVLPIGLKLELA